MLLRLSQASFWLAALAAAVALAVPTGLETLLTGVALVLALLFALHAGADQPRAAPKQPEPEQRRPRPMA